MSLRSTSDRWGSLAIAFHWLVAALILGQFALGWIAEEYRRSPAKIDLFVWHKSIGMLVLALALLRLAWRAFDRKPLLPEWMSPAERAAAWSSHALLYVLMLAMPISGWVINSAANFPLKLFWLIPLPNITAPDKALKELAESAHLALFWVLATVVSIHIAAALRHHFGKRDDILRRMLPGSGKGKPSP